MIIKLGWRVIELSLEQVDLAIYCLSILQAKINCPMKFFAPSHEEEGRVGNDIYRDIWVEWQIL
jgi:hypothetical protein